MVFFKKKKKCLLTLDPYWKAAAAKSFQSCPTLCDPIDGSPPGSPVPGILRARTLERAAIAFSNAWKWKVRGKSLSRVRPSAWTAAHQAPPSVGFCRQEDWSGVPLPSLMLKREALKWHVLALWQRENRRIAGGNLWRHVKLGCRQAVFTHKRSTNGLQVHTYCTQGLASHRSADEEAQSSELKKECIRGMNNVSYIFHFYHI